MLVVALRSRTRAWLDNSKTHDIFDLQRWQSFVTVLKRISVVSLEGA